MTLWKITGRQFSALPPTDWRTQLATRLGHRPRRIGEWAELALWGARHCLDQAQEADLPAEVLLSLSSLHGPDIALRAALDQAKDDVPLPIAFLSSQASQVLPTLARYLGWQGNGRCLSTRYPVQALHLACLESRASGMLIGWVDEDAPGMSLWLRLVPAAPTHPVFLPARFAMLADPQFNYLTFDGRQLQLGR